MSGFSRKAGQASPITLGDLARGMGQWDLAAKHYRTALIRNPENPPIWVQYGHALKESGKHAQAEAAYRRAIEGAPAVADSYLQLGHVLKRQGRAEEATAAYLRALTLDPDLADARRELNGFEWAGNQLTEVLRELASQNGRPSRKRRRPSVITQADRARDLGQWDIAAKLYRKALDRNPRNAAIWLQYGHVLKESGDLEPAASAYRRAIADDPSAAEPYAQLGHVLRIQGKTEEAQACYLRAFARDPTLGDPLSELSGLGWSEKEVAALKALAEPSIGEGPSSTSNSGALCEAGGSDTAGQSVSAAATALAEPGTGDGLSSTSNSGALCEAGGTDTAGQSVSAAPTALAEPGTGGGLSSTSNSGALCEAGGTDTAGQLVFAAPKVFMEENQMPEETKGHDETYGELIGRAAAESARRRGGRRELIVTSGVDLLADESLADLISFPTRCGGVKGAEYDRECLQFHWVIPDFSSHSGGHMTIFRILQWLEVFGHECTIWINGRPQEGEINSRNDLALKYYRCVKAKIISAGENFWEASGDALVATAWQTVAKVMHSINFKERFYFVQDFEPSFYPVGSHHLAAELTYHEDLGCICAGPWLAKILQHRYGRWVRHFWLAVDPLAYYPAEPGDDRHGEVRIAIYARMGTARRAVELIFLALQELADRGVLFHAHLFGSEMDHLRVGFSCTVHGILDSVALGNLYRSSDIGISLSGTNYSLVPQEMMACSLPVVELKADSTQAVFPEGVVTFACPHPTKIADAIARLAESPGLRQSQTDRALTWVSQFSWEKSAHLVERAVIDRLQERGHIQKVKPRAFDSNTPKVSVCIPTFNGGELLLKVVDAVRGQRAPWKFEIVIVDSTSEDGSVTELKSAEDIIFRQIPQSEFEHGKTRNECVKISNGEFVAFLTQDALPADEFWLYSIVTTLEHFPGAAGAFGRHLAWPHHSPFTAKDLDGHFASLMKLPVAVSRITDRERWDRGEPGWRQQLIFYSDNNSCLRRSAWEQIPYPEIEFGEDQVWAEQVLTAGFEKVFAPLAVVFHSHEFTYKKCYERAKTEAEFWKRCFNYDQHVGDEPFQVRLERMNAAAREYGAVNGIAERWIEKRCMENEATLLGQRAAREIG